jgi:hypothetical protein
MVMGILILLLAVILIILEQKGKIVISDRESYNFSAAIVSLIILGMLFVLSGLGFIPAY